MRILLVFILVVVWNVGYSQKVVISVLDTTVAITKENGLSIWAGASKVTSSRDTLVLKNDTAKVLMLVCDTNRYAATTTVFWSQPLARAQQIGMIVYWQYGYRVHKNSRYTEIPNPNYMGENRTCLVYGCTLDHSSKTIRVIASREELNYLDENKQPFPKNIIIWQIK